MIEQISDNYQITLPQLQLLIPQMKTFFDEGNTLNLDIRKNCLKKLQLVIERRTNDICQAVHKDFHKPTGEMLLTEIYTVLADIKHTLANLSKWVKPSSAKTNILLQPASSKIYKSPKGLVLIIAPWNYPFYLTMMPLISAVAAGNVAIIKPANETYHTSLVIAEIIKEVFDRNHVSVVLGEGRTTGELLLNNFSFNHIFFTGSARVGKWIMGQAAQHLTPVTLELGGKSPSIIEKGYDLERAAKKIVWGKFINSGQTCVSTDYVVIHKDDLDAFIKIAVKYIKEFFGNDALTSSNYAHMINDVRFQRVSELLKQGNIVYGGRTDSNTRCIEPTLILPRSMEVELMKEEIFGPVLPLITYSNKEEAIEIIRKNRYPLSLYMFSNDSEFKNFIYQRIEFGGGCENTTVYHLGNPYLPFGGIQQSGFGQYHGQYGFDTFSNTKPILKTAKWFDIPLLYQPYTTSKLNLLKRLFKM